MVVVTGVRITTSGASGERDDSDAHDRCQGKRCAAWIESRSGDVRAARGGTVRLWTGTWLLDPPAGEHAIAVVEHAHLAAGRDLRRDERDLGSVAVDGDG